MTGGVERKIWMLQLGAMNSQERATSVWYRIAGLPRRKGQSARGSTTGRVDGKG
jgi:hypothetical protein